LERRILVSGASGLIGSAWVRAARSASIEVVRLVRDQRAARPGSIYWNHRNSLVVAHPVDLEDFDAVVHLGGATVAQRWTSKVQRSIFSSRVDATRTLCERLAMARRPPRVLLCASAVGFYGNRGEEVLTEQSTAGSGFLADTCTAWEAATRPAQDAGIRVVHLRFGIVLDKNGGALKKMLPAFRCGLGGRLGSGHQWMSWVSLPDVLRAMFFLMDRDDLSGAFNLASPNPVTNQIFTRALARAVHRPAIFPVPRTALRLAFGAMADEGLLASSRALPKRLNEAGFAFENDEIRTTLEALLR
jgi:uncharacterized protein (TIGR01777 family)